MLHCICVALSGRGSTAGAPVSYTHLDVYKRQLLTHRKLLQSKAIALDNDLRGTLRNFGLKVGMVGTVKFEARIKELVENLPDLAVLVEPLLIVRRVLHEQIGVLHRRLLAIVREDDAVSYTHLFGTEPARRR